MTFVRLPGSVLLSQVHSVVGGGHRFVLLSDRYLFFKPKTVNFYLMFYNNIFPSCSLICCFGYLAVSCLCGDGSISNELFMWSVKLLFLPKAEAKQTGHFFCCINYKTKLTSDDNDTVY